MAQWLERRTHDRKVVGVSIRKERRDKYFLQGQLSVLILTAVSVPPVYYRRR